MSRKYIGQAADEMSDFEIIKSMGMYQIDIRTREKGFTIAAVLCFGKDEVIASVIPYWRIDVLERIEDVERFDSRLDISTNLIDTYYRIMDFIDRQQSLPERFYLEGTIRTPARNILFRELVVNMLVHRELSNAFVSTVSIYKDKVDIKNANKPIHAGTIKKPEISPFPKNPSIAKVFRTLGIIDELGSGMSKIFKYGEIYFNSKPIIKNGELFEVNFLKNIDENKETDFKIENAPQKEEKALEKMKNAPQKEEKVPPKIKKAPQNKKVKIEQRREKILEILQTAQYTKRVELSKLLRVSIDTVKRDLSYLKTEGVIEYKGSAKNGKWVIIRNALIKEEKAPQNKKVKIEQRREKILKILQTAQYTKRVELSKLLGVSIDTVKRDLSYLKIKGVIEYKGSAKNGKWVIKK